MLRYTFEWNPVKASENLQRHRISFDRAAEVFQDPKLFLFMTKSTANMRKGG